MAENNNQNKTPLQPEVAVNASNDVINNIQIKKPDLNTLRKVSYGLSIKNSDTPIYNSSGKKTTE